MITARALTPFFAPICCKVSATIASDRTPGGGIYASIWPHSSEYKIESATPDQQCTRRKRRCSHWTLSELPENTGGDISACRIQEWDTNQIAADLSILESE